MQVLVIISSCQSFLPIPITTTTWIPLYRRRWSLRPPPKPASLQLTLTLQPSRSLRLLSVKTLPRCRPSHPLVLCQPPMPVRLLNYFRVPFSQFLTHLTSNPASPELAMCSFMIRAISKASLMTIVFTLAPRLLLPASNSSVIFSSTSRSSVRGLTI